MIEVNKSIDRNLKDNNDCLTLYLFNIIEHYENILLIY